MAAVSILLVDDHLLIRKGIRSYLVDAPNLTIAGEAADGMEALAFIKENPVNLVITDINMQGMDGVELSRQIRLEYPDIAIIALTMLEEPQAIRQILQAGVDGYLLKSCSEQELLSAVEAVTNGERYICKEVTDIMLDTVAKRKEKAKPKSRFDLDIALTVREKEVLMLILNQLSNLEIADKLFISVRTVDAHKRNILEKTGAKNTVGLALFALENGLMDENYYANANS